MFNIYGVIIISILAIFSIILILFLGKKFKVIEIFKFLKLKKEDDSDSIKYKKLKLDEKTKEKQISFAICQIETMKQQIIDLLKTTAERTGFEISEKGYSYFLVVVDNIFLKMEKMFKNDLKIFNFENETDESFEYFKNNRIESIPNSAKSLIPIATILNHKLSCEFLKTFTSTFMKDFAPIITLMLTHTRKLALQNKEKKSLLDKY